MEDTEKYEDLQVDGVSCNDKGFRVYWSSKRKGNGEVTFVNKEGFALWIDHEFMSKEFCIALMTKLIEKYYV